MDRILLLCVAMLVGCAPSAPATPPFVIGESLRPITPAYLILNGTHGLCHLWGKSAEVVVKDIWLSATEYERSFTTIATIKSAGEVFVEPPSTAQPTRFIRECRNGEEVVLQQAHRAEFIKG